MLLTREPAHIELARTEPLAFYLDGELVEYPYQFRVPALRCGGRVVKEYRPGEIPADRDLFHEVLADIAHEANGAR